MPISYDRHMLTMSGGTAETQRDILDAESAGHDFKLIAPFLVPGVLQTRGYAAERLREATDLLGLPDTVDETVEVRMRRAALLGDETRMFHVIVSESALYGGADEVVMGEQLAHLEALAGRHRNLRLGVVPFGARVATAMSHVDIVDRRHATVETLAVSYRVSDAPEVAMYLRVFDDWAVAAVYGEVALELIRAAG
jgi:hypothetical protein